MATKITVFDTSVCSENIGDYIIMDAVNNELKNLFSDGMFFHSYTHDKIGKATYQLIKKSDYSFIGGTNLLSSNMNSYNQWKINLLNSFYLKNVILMGVGWWQYQKKPNLYTKILLKSILHKDILHSVRDSYTETMLKTMGIDNVVNTGCPTMWKLIKQHCMKIPYQKADSVVFTLTDYNQSPKADLAIIQYLRNSYDTVYFWPQGMSDIDYFNTLGSFDDIIKVSASLNAYDKLLQDTSISLDYVGTRLHAGIRALQKYRRTIIIAIDNRAMEKSKDFNLLIVHRNDQKLLEKTIESPFTTEIRLPLKNITKWKNQFNGNSVS
ncbi:MAG: polysaccharide pyruvyl transferase family protein [Deltaproteobacteria bacterium]|nr:polysaccharide pyruvyl transferase family protein [Deltaproteobacteria bacterium]